MLDLFFFALTSLPFLLLICAMALVVGVVVGLQRHSFNTGFKCFAAPVLISSFSLAGALACGFLAEAMSHLALVLPKVPHPAAMGTGALLGALLALTLLLAPVTRAPATKKS